MKKRFKIIAAISLIIIIGLAGNEECAEQYVLANVSTVAQEEIYQKLGRDASAVSVKREYLTHKAYYDAKTYE